MPLPLLSGAAGEPHGDGIQPQAGSLLVPLHHPPPSRNWDAAAVMGGLASVAGQAR